MDLRGIKPLTDILDFSGQAWGSNKLGVLGLVADTGTLTNVGTVAGDTSATGVSVHAAQVAPGGTIAGTGTDFIELSQGSYLNANAVAGALQGGSYTITHSTLAAGAEADFLVAYQGIDGNTHIADLQLTGGTKGTTTTAADTVHVSDMVDLVGVNLAQFNASHVHLIT